MLCYTVFGGLVKRGQDSLVYSSHPRQGFKEIMGDKTAYLDGLKELISQTEEEPNPMNLLVEEVNDAVCTGGNDIPTKARKALKSVDGRERQLDALQDKLC